MRINPKDKMITSKKMEKWVLRKAFEDELPHSIVWRQKEQFSDGVGYNWIDKIKEFVEQSISDNEMNQVNFRFPIQPPRTKEEYFYRKIFENHFPSDTSALTVPSLPSIACSSPKALEWDESFRNINEPSGRAINKVHNDSYFK